MQYVAFDSHKRYTLAAVEGPQGERLGEQRIDHARGNIAQFLAGCDRGSPVAVETVGNWYWIVQEIEAAGMVPHLVHARKAKLMMGSTNKSDILDVRGLNRLQRIGTLPTVWIPPAEIRDQRDLPRTRMLLVQTRTRLKNRILATLAKYMIPLPELTDRFGVKGRAALPQAFEQLPPSTRFSAECLLAQVGQLDDQIDQLEDKIHAAVSQSPAFDLLRTLPGVGVTLAVVILWELGEVSRFATAAHLASYAGTTPRLHASGGKIRMGQLRSDVNHYLKWAFVEAANGVCMHRRRHADRHVSQLYERLKARKGHQKAIGAVARHLAEAAFWILTKQEPYRDPALRVRQVSSTAGSAR